MLELKKLSLEANDEAELRIIRMMVETNESFLNLGIISAEEHQNVLQTAAARLTELEHRYGLDIIA